ncbi:MAG: hypothetical protein ACJ72A_22960, partial [Nocardioidaceae bacterium]
EQAPRSGRLPVRVALGRREDRAHHRPARVIELVEITDVRRGLDGARPPGCRGLDGLDHPGLVVVWTALDHL